MELQELLKSKEGGWGQRELGKHFRKPTAKTWTKEVPKSREPGKLCRGGARGGPRARKAEYQGQGQRHRVQVWGKWE